jgi:heptosyltransferase-1
VRLLIVKTSSMGDVVHATRWWPTSCATTRAQIDWLVEPAFAAIPQMHPGVQRC